MIPWQLIHKPFLELSDNMIAVVARVVFPIYRCPALLLLFAAPVLAGQQAHTIDMKLNRLSVEQGLSQSTVNAIIEDSQGLMWFGTQDGLNMYDGYNFTVFKHDPADSNSISDNWITSLFLDRDGNIWIGTLEGGLNLYPANRDRFIHFRNDPSQPASLSGNNITAIHQDVAGTLWVGAWGGGLNRYEPQTNTFWRFRSEKGDASSLSDNQVYCISEDATGTLWIGTWGGLTSLDKTRKVFTRYLSTRDAGDQSKGEKVTGIFESADGVLWIGTQDHGLMVYDRKKDRVVPCNNPTNPSLNTLRIWAICGGPERALWIATSGNGVINFDPVSGITTGYSNDPFDSNSLYNNSALRVFRDSRDIVWIATEGGGITMMNPQQRRFRHYYHQQRDPHSLSHNHVRSIVEADNGDLWIGTEGGGLNQFRVSTRQFYSYRDGSFNTVVDRSVFSLYQERMGDLWIGTDTGVLRYAHKSKRALRVPLGIGKGGRQSLANVTAITGEQRGRLWFGTYGDGLCQYEPGTGKCVWFHRKIGDTTSLNGDWILSLLVDTKGELWVGTWGTGLGRFDRSNGTFHRYRNDRTNPSSLSNNTVNCIAESRDGTLWVGTSAGLNKLDRSSDHFVSYSEKDGLPNGVVYGIIEDDERNLWLSTNHGIAKFNPGTKRCRSFDVSDGLQGNEFNSGAFCRARSGQFYFGGINGLTEFIAGEIRDDSPVPPIVLTSFKIFDKPARLPRFISLTNSIELSYWENFFSFEFVAANYLNPSKTRYVYMMEGFDRDWVQSGTRRYASYTHLDPGNYVFRVRASNGDGVWDTHGEAVHIRIVPPLWQTWWFRLGVGLIFIGLVALVYQRRVGTLKRDQRAQQEFSMRLMESQENERKRIAGELHDSLGQDFLVVRNRALLGLKDPGLSEHIRDQLDQISSVATQAINNVREISYDLRPYQLDRLGLTKAIASLASVLADSSSIQFSMDIDHIDNEIEKEQAIHVYRIVQEGINNILKHSGANEARVEVRVTGNDVRITISDNGKGTPSESPGDTNSRKGFGLIGITERAHAMNGAATIESTPGKGTTLTVVIPGSRKPA